MALVAALVAALAEVTVVVPVVIGIFLAAAAAVLEYRVKVQTALAITAMVTLVAAQEVGMLGQLSQVMLALLKGLMAEVMVVVVVALEVCVVVQKWVLGLLAQFVLFGPAIPARSPQLVQEVHK
jgi:hypothetical protein